MTPLRCLCGQLAGRCTIDDCWYEQVREDRRQLAISNPETFSYPYVRVQSVGNHTKGMVR